MPDKTIYHTSDRENTELMQLLPDLSKAPISPAIPLHTKLVLVIHGARHGCLVWKGRSAERVYGVHRPGLSLNPLRPLLSLLLLLPLRLASTETLSVGVADFIHLHAF